jgi:hypothetical protein
LQSPPAGEYGVAFFGRVDPLKMPLARPAVWKIDYRLFNLIGKNVRQ